MVNRGSMRVVLWLLLSAVSSVVGAVVFAVLLVLANPGVKGPHVTDDQLMAALGAGAVVGALVPLSVWGWRAWRQRAASVGRVG
jgi:hypothetical protein